METRQGVQAARVREANSEQECDEKCCGCHMDLRDEVFFACTQRGERESGEDDDDGKMFREGEEKEG